MMIIAHGEKWWAIMVTIDNDGKVSICFVCKHDDVDNDDEDDDDDDE